MYWSVVNNSLSQIIDFCKVCGAGCFWSDPDPGVFGRIPIRGIMVVFLKCGWILISFFENRLDLDPGFFGQILIRGFKIWSNPDPWVLGRIRILKIRSDPDSVFKIWSNSDSCFYLVGSRSGFLSDSDPV